jgi:hypothetical protein
MHDPRVRLKSILKATIKDLKKRQSKDKCVKFMMNKEQMSKEKNKDRLLIVRKYINEKRDLTPRRKKALIRHFTNNIHLYRVGSEIGELSDDEFLFSTKDNEYMNMKKCLDKFSKTVRGSEEEEKVLLELFSIHIPGYEAPPDIEDTDPITREMNDIGFPFTAPDSVQQSTDSKS